MKRAHTFTLPTTRPDEVGQACGRVYGEESNGLLLLSGALARHASRIAKEIARSTRRSWLVVAGAGVLSEEGELESSSAAVGLCSEDIAEHLLFDRGDATFADGLAERLARSPGASGLVFLRSDHNDDGWLDELNRKGRNHNVFGGGSLPGTDIYLSHEGRVRHGAAAATIMNSSSTARVRASSACRLLSPLGRITRSRGSMVQEIEGAAALDRLNEATADLEEQLLVLLAIAGENAPLSAEGRSLALRAIQGVDPSRGALMIGEELPKGTKVAFAVRDAHSARTDLRAQLKSLKKSSEGGAPEFGIYFCCAGRGVGLYGTRDVDVRLIKTAFPNVSLIGLHSTFELAPLDDRIVAQIYTGVLGMFFRPS